MPFSACLRVLAMLCLSALLLATPNFSSYLQAAAGRTAADSSFKYAPLVSDTHEKLRLVDHLNKVWQVPLVLAHRIVGAAYREAQTIGAAPTLLLAVMAKESGFKPSAASSYGAVGLMQVVPRFHPEKLAKGEKLTNPETNIRVGTRVLGEYLSKAGGEIEPALERYSGQARQYFPRVRQYQFEFEQARSTSE